MLHGTAWYRYMVLHGTGTWYCVVQVHVLHGIGTWCCMVQVHGAAWYRCMVLHGAAWYRYMVLRGTGGGCEPCSD